MTVKEYVSGKFAMYNIKLSKSALFDIYHFSGVQGDVLMSDAIFDRVHIGIARFIPSLFGRPNWVSEGSFSTSWKESDRNGLLRYYVYLCKTYGLEDLLSDRPVVSFL
jgi:hypothetical protein